MKDITYREYKVVAIYGSPRRDGNTDELLNKFLEGLRDCDSFSTDKNSQPHSGSPIHLPDDVDPYTKIAGLGMPVAKTVKSDTTKLKTEKFILDIEKIILSNLRISPCWECRHCSIDGECIVNDEMQKIYPKMMDCDLLVIASPIFFTSVSGQLKAFIDRFQRFWALKYELGKNIISKTDRKGILLSCAGSKPPDIFDCTKKITRALFDVLNIRYHADFLYNSIDFKGDILKDPGHLKRIYQFAKDGTFVE